MGDEHTANSDPLALILSRHDGGLIKRFAGTGFIIVAAITAITLLPMAQRPIEPDATLYVVLGSGMALAATTYAIPWATLPVHRATNLLTALMVTGIITVGALVSETGGATSELLWVVLLITIFAATILSRARQIALFVLTAVAYVVGALAAGPVALGTATLRLTLIGLVALSAGSLAGLMRSALAAQEEAKRSAEDHARRLGTVARGVRSAASTDPVEVLDAVAETVRTMGWDDVAIFVAGEQRRLELAAWMNEPGSPPGTEALTTSAAWAAEVLAEARTVSYTDAAGHPSFGSQAERLGVASVIGCPFVADGEAAGVVIAGTSQPHRFSDEDIETFELVASCAGRALELARRYENERERVTELRELDRLRSEFLSTVSHELRTPLTVILGLSETLDRAWDALSDGRRRHLIARVSANAGGLDRVISTLLDFTRLEQGRLETRLEAFDLGRLIEMVTSRLGSLLEHHHLVVDAPASLPAYGDEHLLERVLENLLSNAQRHTPPGTTVTVTAGLEGRQVVVSVADDGPGIAKEDLARLGERFYRAGDPRHRPSRGVGLGLALAQEVLRLHDSRLHVESAPGEGTVFRFTLGLPLQEEGFSPPRGTNARSR